MSEETLEELVESYSRVALDEIAEALGLDSADYPNKRSISEAILTAKEEQRERERMERERERERMANEREERIQELKNKMVENTVRGKIAAIKVTAEMMQKSVKALQSEIQKQMNENMEAAATMQSGTQELQSLIEEQVKENQAVAKDFQSRVVAMQTDIKGQMNANETYVKNFYG